MVAPMFSITGILKPENNKQLLLQNTRENIMLKICITNN